SHFNVWHFPREAARKAPYPISYTVGEKALSGLVSVRSQTGTRTADGATADPKPTPFGDFSVRRPVCYWEEGFTGCASQFRWLAFDILLMLPHSNKCGAIR